MVLMVLVKEIEKLREELNKVVVDNKKPNNENVITISRKLDVLIHKFYAEGEKSRS